MKGRLYGIGTGPGDPELLTLKAVAAIKKCGVIALPAAGNGERTAFNIVEAYVEGKRLLECIFAMERDDEKRKQMRIVAADKVCEVLDTGEDVGFITLGDPTVYSTYMYVHKIVKERGYETEIIPGIPSFIAVAAAVNDSLCEGGEQLHIIPASDNDDIDSLLNLPGNKVIMKSGKSLAGVLNTLKSKGLSGKAKIVENCTMETERIYENVDELLLKGGAGYFTVVIVKE